MEEGVSLSSYALLKITITPNMGCVYITGLKHSQVILQDTTGQIGTVANLVWTPVPKLGAGVHWVNKLSYTFPSVCVCLCVPACM